MKRINNWIRKLWCQQQGITGLETAIVLIAFVVVSSVFAFATLSAGLFSSDKAKETIEAGLAETRSTLEVKGGIKAASTLTTIPTTVTGESVGTGDGVQTVLTLANSPVVTNSETVYLDGAAQVRDTDYTINFTTGAITFTAAPGVGVAVTADYQHSRESVGTGDGSQTVFNLANSPVISGTGLVVYLDGTAQTLGTNYTVNYSTGAITFTAAPGVGVAITADYTHYTIDSVKVALANAAGGQPIDLTGGETIVGYQDTDTLANNITNYTLTRLGNADADNLLEEGEVFEISVDVSTYGLSDQDEFTLTIQPPDGATLNLTRRIPVTISALMGLG